MIKITGTLKVRNEEILVTANFKKRELVLTDASGKYPQYISMQLTQDRCSLADPFNLGDNLVAEVEIRGREWNAPNGEVKYINSLEVLKLKRAAKADEE